MAEVEQEEEPKHKRPQQALHLVEPEPKRHLVEPEPKRHLEVLDLAGLKLLPQELVAEVRFLILPFTERELFLISLVKHLIGMQTLF
jgi:hypothetical protein